MLQFRRPNPIDRTQLINRILNYINQQRILIKKEERKPIPKVLPTYIFAQMTLLQQKVSKSTRHQRKTLNLLNRRKIALQELRIARLVIFALLHRHLSLPLVLLLQDRLANLIDAHLEVLRLDDLEHMVLYQVQEDLGHSVIGLHHKVEKNVVFHIFED